MNVASALVMYPVNTKLPQWKLILGGSGTSLWGLSVGGSISDCKAVTMRGDVTACPGGASHSSSSTANVSVRLVDPTYCGGGGAF